MFAGDNVGYFVDSHGKPPVKWKSRTVYTIRLHVDIQLLSAVIVDFAKEILPLHDNLRCTRFDDRHDIAEYTRRNFRVVIAEQASSHLGDPHFCRVSRGTSFGNMDMNRLQRVIFVRPEINPVRTDLKNLRHRQILLLLRI